MSESLPEKIRLIVTTDISDAEPDDKQSMVRLMLYSNEFDIEGLIANTSCFRARRNHPIAPEKITEIIDAYAKVHSNLLLHDSDYPSPDYLHSQIKRGNGHGMAAVGEGKETAGSQHIVAALRRDDSRPVWIALWGGASTVAQALWNLRADCDTRILPSIIQKIRIFDITGQDDAGAWIAHTFPDIFYIRQCEILKGMSLRKEPEFSETWGADASLVSRQWFRRNIQDNHGPLGLVYPDAKFLYEGDTPTFLYLLPNGLSNPEKPWYGSWGGRYTRDTVKNLLGIHWLVDERQYFDYRMFGDASDTWHWEGQEYTNPYCTIFRWREAFQNDFAARMDRCILPAEKVNHNPVAIVNGDRTCHVLEMKAKPGENVVLDGSQSFDPDGDDISFTWWMYREAGTFTGGVEISRETQAIATVHVPMASAGKEFHIILTLKDSGEPALYAYRRIIFHVEPRKKV